MKYVLLLVFLLINSTVFAGTTVFGLELGKTTESELKKKYRVFPSKTSKWPGGNEYTILTENINIDGLILLKAFFNNNNILVSIIAAFPNSKFEYLNKLLGEKYKLMRSDIGSSYKMTKYYDKTTEITIDTGRFFLTVSYIDIIILDCPVKRKEELDSEQEIKSLL